MQVTAARGPSGFISSTAAVDADGRRYEADGRVNVVSCISLPSASVGNIIFGRAATWHALRIIGKGIEKSSLKVYHGDENNQDTQGVRKGHSS